MSRSLTTLFNQALGSIGAAANVSLPEEHSREADVCRLYYDDVRRYVLSMAHWGCARSEAQLALLSANTLAYRPPGSYSHTFALPQDFLHPWHLLDLAPFELGSTGQRRTLLTNSPSAALRYSRDVETLALWDHSLYMAVVATLAAYIAMPLTNDRIRAREKQAEANGLLASAQTQNANAREVPQQHVPDWIAARGFTAYQRTSPYIFPFPAPFALHA